MKYLKFAIMVALMSSVGFAEHENTSNDSVTASQQAQFQKARAKKYFILNAMLGVTAACSTVICGGITLQQLYSFILDKPSAMHILKAAAAFGVGCFSAALSVMTLQAGVLL